MAYTHELVAECLQNEPAFCSAACPFGLDVRDLIGKIRQGRFNIAYKTYQYAVGFPGIVAALCPEPCKIVCPLRDAGGSIDLKMLEKACIRHARNTEPDQYNMPSKPQRIAIIGAGISGLACALRLTTRKYQVTLFEKTDRIGGHLNDLLPPEQWLADIHLQFKHEHFDLFLNQEVTAIDDPGFDAFYIATGSGGPAFGMELHGNLSFSTNRPGTFAGGSLTGADTMTAIMHGLNAANAIETWLKIGSMNHTFEPKETKLPYEAIRIIPTEAVIASDGLHFSKEEAVTESKRCLNCCCDACNHYSPLMSYFRKFPKKITEEVHVTIHPSSLDGAAKLATRYTSACNHCGLCKEVCPKDIDTGAFLLQSHRTMRKAGIMPWAFHEFYLRDMAFSMEEAGLSLTPPGYERSRYMFFPGCQLGASNPEYVTQSYRFLLEFHPDTSLLLGCCGAPAEWAGDEELHSGVVEKIRAEWQKSGEPVLVVACPTCRQMFQQYLPEIAVEFIYSLMAEQEKVPARSYDGISASVYDPCASRHEPILQQMIRNFAEQAGFVLEPLPMEGKMAECCSYGGQVGIAHPPYAGHIVQKRITQKNTPFITYCSNCRDIFAAAGKQTWHILDVVFGIGDGNANGLTVTDRQKNRLELKKRILTDFHIEEPKMEKLETNLLISPELREKLNRNYILETDLLTVIEHCEQSGHKLFDPVKETFSGYLQIGNMTYWVEYKVTDQLEYELLNGYCHRMKIGE